MKRIEAHLYARGKLRRLYCRVRVPHDLLTQQPSQPTHIVKALGTSDLTEGRRRLRLTLAGIELELAAQRAVRDDPGRRSGAWHDSTADLASWLRKQLACIEPPPLAAVEPSAARPVATTAPSATAAVVGAVATWQQVFDAWVAYVPRRPSSTILAARTPWTELQAFAASRHLRAPADLTPAHLTAFVDHMGERGLAVDTINQRLSKVKGVLKIAVGRHLLGMNPARDTLGKGKSAVERRTVTRVPFTPAQLQTLFGSPIFSQHLRSKGQAGEASYWIPVMMYFTGARPEEIAGLAVADIVRDDKLDCWYFHITDRPDASEGGAKGQHALPARTLKNGASTRKVPVASELIDLGLLRYRQHVQERGHAALFPTLRPDVHGKLSGGFCKFFGRYLRQVGIADPKVVLYSLRHTVKDLLEAAEVPSKYLKRLMGHTSGDGAVTDGYGSDVPLPVLVRQFARLRFHPIPARPWQPGRGVVRLPSARPSESDDA